MQIADVLSAQRLNTARADRLYELDFASTQALPEPQTTVMHGGQAYLVVGVVDFGDQRGAKVLALMQVPDGAYPDWY